MGELGDLSAAAPSRVPSRARSRSQLRARSWPLLLSVAFALGGAAAQAPPAGEYRTGPLVIKDPWSRPTPPGISVGVVYLSISNTGPRPDRLVAVASPRAPHAELHETRTVKGMTEMRQVEGVDCPPGVTVRIAPGGLHIMLVGLDAPLAPGSRFDLTLSFREGGSITVPVRVEARAP